MNSDNLINLSLKSDGRCVWVDSSKISHFFYSNKHDMTIISMSCGDTIEVIELPEIIGDLLNDVSY